MKEAIGGVSLFQIVIVFLLLFTGVMCLTINHSKAFGVKDEIINIIQEEKLASYGTTSDYALTSDTIDDIVKSRLKKDIALENKAHFEMEKIIVGTKQDLTVIIDYLKNLQEN